MVTRWKRVAGIAGRIAAPPCKKFAGGLFPPVSSARPWACPEVWMSRGEMAMPEELEVPKCAHVGAGHASSIPPATHTPPCGWTGRAVCDTRVWMPVCAWRGGCVLAVSRLLCGCSFYVLFTAEKVLSYKWGLQKALKMAWSHFSCCIGESPSVLH